MKYEDDIHNCTNERLAEILEVNARFERFCIENNYIGIQEARPEDVLPPILWVTAVMEAANRLRERHKHPFNHEAFE